MQGKSSHTLGEKIASFWQKLQFASAQQLCCWYVFYLGIILALVTFWRFLESSNNHAEWITAFATAAIAGFTFSIRSINSKQLSHLKDVERAYISGGGGPERGKITLSANSYFGGMVAGTALTGTPTTIEVATGNFNLQVHNDGKTVGTLTAYAIGFCSRSELLKTGEVIYDKKAWEDKLPPLCPSRSINTPEKIKIPEGKNVAYGRFWYEDIWGDKHSYGFILSLANDDSYPDITAVSPCYTECW